MVDKRLSVYEVYCTHLRTRVLRSGPPDVGSAEVLELPFWTFPDFDLAQRCLGTEQGLINKRTGWTGSKSIMRPLLWRRRTYGW